MNDRIPNGTTVHREFADGGAKAAEIPWFDSDAHANGLVRQRVAMELGAAQLERIETGIRIEMLEGKLAHRGGMLERAMDRTSELGETVAGLTRSVADLKATRRPLTLEEMAQAGWTERVVGSGLARRTVLVAPEGYRPMSEAPDFPSTPIEEPAPAPAQAPELPGPDNGPDAPE